MKHEMTKLERKNIERNEKHMRHLMFGIKVGRETETKCYVCKHLFSLKMKSYEKDGCVYADAKCSECDYSVDGLWVKTSDSNMNERMGEISEDLRKKRAHCSSVYETNAAKAALNKKIVGGGQNIMSIAKTVQYTVYCDNYIANDSMIDGDPVFVHSKREAVRIMNYHITTDGKHLCDNCFKERSCRRHR